ncbi:MAG: hypothetical protein AMJ94_09670 [Deltaproteobacteria bacterium SM23_61]|nr:MAG: hypothetical protein AMJ94_09670 [Deltaproteobacteria bacterium SM23_61]
MAEEPRFNKLKTEAVQKIYESNQELIYGADRKVAALLLINAILISFSATWNLRDYSSSIKIIILIAVLLAALSTILYLLAIIPRISEQAPKSILHYKGILASSRESYLSKMTEISDDDLMKDYLNTIYSLSSIQRKKNLFLRRGSESLIISISLLALSFVLNNL